ncbi:C-type lectin domain family 6 member A-like [Ruditapes philippinarum]|uniref:C-type lectin domain family 6 member A-like n=1 Tax=Ruditapes philippinarum TaxID=129788 RepID=UPI00295B3205|nr:C-type lectin domain family 6 member A-like [Ruditapes philippinarum]
MDCYNNKILMLVIFYVTASSINCAPFSYENGTNAGDLNGEKLMEIGKKLKLPMLQMIGKTIDNIEKEICKLHPCSDWSVWSVCVARFGQIGSKVRTRQCNVNKTRCEIHSNSRTEKEFGICIGYCPNGYNITKNGFCIKFYSDKKVKKEAEKHCQKDGGHLVNIDSELKYNDVSSLLTDLNTNRWIWIDGHRKDVSSPWKYTYGSQKGFFKWSISEPHNGSNDLCLFITLYSHGVKWHDITCTSLHVSICEISKEHVVY